MLSQVLLLLLKNLVLLDRDLIFVLEVVNLPFELDDLDLVILLELLNLVLEAFELLIPKTLLFFFLPSELRKFVGQFFMLLVESGEALS